MTSVSQVEMSLKHILEERANVLARETGCIQRQRNGKRLTKHDDFLSQRKG